MSFGQECFADAQGSVKSSRTPQVLEGKTQYMEFTGNLVPVLKTGEQLQLPFRAFKENRVPFTARIKDPDAADMMGRIMFMSEPKVPRGELPQTPICTLNILLPEKISPDTAVSELDLLELSKNYSFLRDGGISKSTERTSLKLPDFVFLLNILLNIFIIFQRYYKILSRLLVLSFYYVKDYLL